MSESKEHQQGDESGVVLDLKLRNEIIAKLAGPADPPQQSATGLELPAGSDDDGNG
jgi:hypothetical protein